MTHPFLAIYIYGTEVGGRKKKVSKPSKTTEDDETQGSASEDEKNEMHIVGHKMVQLTPRKQKNKKKNKKKNRVDVETPGNKDQQAPLVLQLAVLWSKPGGELGEVEPGKDDWFHPTLVFEDSEEDVEQYVMEHPELLNPMIEALCPKTYKMWDYEQPKGKKLSVEEVNELRVKWEKRIEKVLQEASVSVGNRDATHLELDALSDHPDTDVLNHVLPGIQASTIEHDPVINGATNSPEGIMAAPNLAAANSEGGKLQDDGVTGGGLQNENPVRNAFDYVIMILHAVHIFHSFVVIGC
jgi:hypothetical protein